MLTISVYDSVIIIYKRYIKTQNDAKNGTNCS